MQLTMTIGRHQDRLSPGREVVRTVVSGGAAVRVLALGLIERLGAS